MKNCNTCLGRYGCSTYHESICKDHDLQYYEYDESSIVDLSNISQDTYIDIDKKEDLDVNDILDKIKNDLSIEDVGDVLKTALCTIYDKLRKDYGFYHYDMYCIVPNIGSDERDTEIMFIDSPTRDSESEYRSVYKI